MDDSIKQALIDRFRGYLDMVEDGEEHLGDQRLRRRGLPALALVVMLLRAARRSIASVGAARR